MHESVTKSLTTVAKHVVTDGMKIPDVAGRVEPSRILKGEAYLDQASLVNDPLPPASEFP